MKILPVTLPLEPLIERFVPGTLAEGLADSKAGSCLMLRALGHPLTAYPSLSLIVRPMPAERGMYLVD